MKLVKTIAAISTSLVLLVVLILNIRLYYQPEYGSSNINEGLIHQLSHLKEEMHTGGGQDMQQIFPEGFVFLNALYALSWVEVAEQVDNSENLYKEALTEINWVLDELASNEARSTFDENLNLPYGIFYTGWNNYVLGRKLKLTLNSESDSLEIIRFRKKCDQILNALHSNNNNPFLESYSGACWPADMTVAMASISLGNNLFSGTYQDDITKWLDDVEARTDSLQLIPHSSDHLTGEVIESSRGSSQSLILNFLFEIDSVYARKKFEVYKKQFLDYRLGLPGIREYPIGESGSGDIDSGPVIFGIGGAASIVGQRTMGRYSDSIT